MEQSDYSKYRGKCKEMSEELIAADPTLRLVRGFYFCPIWGKQAHWWCEDAHGEIIDPTVKQFPSAVLGADYEEYDGSVECEFCSKSVREDAAYINGHHPYCSSQCAMRDVGL